jgi:hypothetical protein
MSKLRQLIRESINDYIREIDEAGNIAALEAKMGKTQEAIELREKKMNMEGIDEAYHDMLDKGKMKELGAEVKVLEKSLTKYKKMLDKLKSKLNGSPKVEKEEEKEIVDEVEMDVDLEENEGMGMEMGMEDERFDADGTPNEEGMYDAEGNRVSFADIDKVDYEMNMNESFLHMQKLAGVITEAQYKAKKKVLNEGEYSDWWAKADDELGLDFNDDIYSYVDSYDEPWQGKFANEVVNIDADNYEDFKNQVKQLYDEINPF